MQPNCQADPVGRSRFLSVWGVVVFATLLLIGGTAWAQELSVLHSFASAPVGTDGDIPNSSLVEDGSGNFYGTTITGGGGFGTVYKVAPDGTVTLLHSFGGTLSVATNGTQSGSFSGVITIGSVNGNPTIADGTNPSGSLILGTDGNLYGTTVSGGTYGYGIVYKIAPDGAYTIIHTFGSTPATLGGAADLGLGAYPVGGVIDRSDGCLYGTTLKGGDAGLGVIFQIKADGTYTIIHDFETGGDAVSPALGLVQDAHGNLYGATALGGTGGYGAVYTLSSQNIYSVIYSFTATSTAYTFTLSSAYSANGIGGLSPNSPLAIGADGNLYGTATTASNYGLGAIYQVTPAGQFTVVHFFGDGSVAADGGETTGTAELSGAPTFPLAGDRLVIGMDGNFHGVSALGGTAKKGTVFEMTPAGHVSIVHSFGDGTVTGDGADPFGMIQGANGNFYGATQGGGSTGHGTVFKITTAAPMFTSPLQVNASTAAPFSYQVTATQGPDTFTVGTLPGGFAFDGTSIISAAPTLPGTYTVQLTATNAAGSTTVPLTITVLAPPVITSLLDVVGSTTSLGYNILASGSPTSFTATGLPPGVSVDPANGYFYGVPTTAGTYQVTVSATNAVGTGSAIVSVDVLSSAPTADQEYQQIHSFQDGTVEGEGSYPGAMILGSDTNLYGVTAQGGTLGDGTIFKLSPAGAASVVATFNGTNGAEPQGVIQTADGTLYGTARNGGDTAGDGTLFKVTPDGTVTVLHTFGGTAAGDGSNPGAGLLLASDGNFYGTTQYGGTANLGTVFMMTPAGVVTILHSFGDSSVTNDGAQPVAALVQVPGVSLTVNGISSPVVMYGTTLQGGAQGDGSIFIVSGKGAVFINHSFGDPSVTAGDGQLPRGPLTLSQGVLFGMTSAGGSIGKGAIFKEGLLFASPGYSVIHNFGDGTVASDGENPSSALVAVPTGAIPSGLSYPTGTVILSGSNGGTLSTGGSLVITGVAGSSPIVAGGGALGTGGSGVGVTLYGTTQNGGTANTGTVFSYAIPTSGTATMTILHNSGDSAFANDGTIPLGGLCLGADGNIYGTTIGGGGFGTAYGIEINQGNPLLIPTPGAFTCTGTIPAGLTFDSTTGTFSGTPLFGDASGIYTLTVTPTSGGLGGTPTPQTITIKLNQTYASWTAAHPPAITSLVGTGGNTGAAGSDNVPMVEKYLTGVNPGKPMQASDYAALPSIGMDSTSQAGDTFLTLSWRQSAAATGVGVVLYSSTDMQSWSLVSGANLISKATGPADSSGNTPMEMGVKMTGSAQQFVRLQVTPPSQ